MSDSMAAGPPTRVTFVTHYTELYGANLSLLNLIEGLAPYGVQAHVLCPDRGDLLPALDRRGVPWAVIPFEWWVSSHRTLTGTATRLAKNVRRLRSITRQMAAWETDLVYSNSSVFAVGAMAAAELDLPHVWHLREFGRRDYDLWPDFGTRLCRLAFRTADATIFVSHALQRACLGKAVLPNSQVIYNGIAPAKVFDDRKQAAEATRGRKQPFTFVLVGRFRESKGQAVAIRALAAGPADARLLLVGGAGNTGDQGYYDGCRSLVTDLGLTNRVEFWGYVPDPERAFLAADAALMCSRNEAMGRVTAEAMSAARPVIGFDAGGTTELIEDGRTGQLYRGDETALAVCLAKYCESPDLAKQHGDAGWHLARRRHTEEVYSSSVNAVLRGVLSARG